MIMKTYTVGRMSTADIRLPNNRTVSRVHVTISSTHMPNVYVLHNNNPTNGTFVMQQNHWEKLPPSASLSVTGDTQIRMGDCIHTIRQLLNMAYPQPEAKNEPPLYRQEDSNVPPLPPIPTLPPLPDDDMPPLPTELPRPARPYRNELGEIIE